MMEDSELRRLVEEDEVVRRRPEPACFVILPVSVEVLLALPLMVPLLISFSDSVGERRPLARRL